MSFFSSDEYLSAAARAFFPGRPWRIEHLEVDERWYRVLVVGRRRVAMNLPFLDYIEPLSARPPEGRRGGFLPRVVHERISVEAWERERREECFLPSPYIEWSQVSGWEPFFAAVKKRVSVDTARKRRKLQREHGEVRFSPQEDDRALLELLMTWKSGQYRDSGLADLFRDAQVRRFFCDLHEAGVLEVSALYAGDRPVALHAGATWRGTFLYWLPAYDPELSRTSPGTLHLLDMLEHSLTSGHQRFDFLLGGEAYKWIYATHVACVAPAGKRSLAARAYRAGRERLMLGVRQAPRLHATLQAGKRLVQERGWLR